MQALVIYDLTGKIWNIIYGDTDIPQGVPCLKVDIPEGAQLERIDLTDPKNPQPVFYTLPETDYGRTQKQIDSLNGQLSDVQVALTEQYEKNVRLEDEVTNLQLALATIYEGSN